jgi:chaperonin cofactor prefoldin
LANRRAQEYQDAIDVLDEAQDIVGSIYQGGADFIELARVAKKMIQISTVSNGHKLYAPVFAAFAQLATKEKQIDDSSLERVAQLIETLRDKVQETYNAFAENDAEAVQAFNDQKERLDSNLARLEAQAARLAKEVDELGQCIGTQSAIAQTASNKLQRNQQLWDQAKGLCLTFDNEYNYATQTRRHELQLVSELEALVERRFAQVEDENAQRRVDIKEASGF